MAMTLPEIDQKRLAEVQTMHRSVSQITQYERCPMAYRLARIDKAWQRPAAWLAHGSAVHSAVEAYEKSGRTLDLNSMLEVFDTEYADGINRAAADGVSMSYWSRSGPYDGPTDVSRRARIGREHTTVYHDWAQKADTDHVWTTPTGELAVELEVRPTIGGVDVLGYIDNLSVVDGQLRIRDLKTGQSPGESFQLGVYSEAIRQAYGEDIRYGDFWMTKKGGPTKPYDLSGWTPDKLAERVVAMDEGVKAANFDPKPDPDTCRMCSVSRACPFFLS